MLLKREVYMDDVVSSPRTASMPTYEPRSIPQRRHIHHRCTSKSNYANLHSCQFSTYMVDTNSMRHREKRTKSNNESIVTVLRAFSRRSFPASTPDHQPAVSASLTPPPPQRPHRAPTKTPTPAWQRPKTLTPRGAPRRSPSCATTRAKRAYWWTSA